MSQEERIPVTYPSLEYIELREGWQRLKVSNGTVDRLVLPSFVGEYEVALVERDSRILLLGTSHKGVFSLVEFGEKIRENRNYSSCQTITQSEAELFTRFQTSDESTCSTEIRKCGGIPGLNLSHFLYDRLAIRLLQPFSTFNIVPLLVYLQNLWFKEGYFRFA